MLGKMEHRVLCFDSYLKIKSNVYTIHSLNLLDDVDRILQPCLDQI